MDEFKNHTIDDPVPEADWVSSPNVVRTDKTLVVKDFFIADDKEVQFLRGQRIFHGTTGTNYTLAVTDFLIGITSLANPISIGLPKPSMVGAGKVFIIKDEVGGAGTTTITVRSEGEKTIDGATSLAITINYASYEFYTDGANWFIF